MDDMASKINGLLQDPEAMKQIQALASMFAAGQAPSPESDPEPPPAAPAAAVPHARPAAPAREAPAMASISPEAMQTVMKLMPLLSSMNQETNNTRFLHALRPLLSENRQKKLDDATHIMQLMQVLPMLKKGGIL